METAALLTAPDSRNTVRRLITNLMRTKPPLSEPANVLYRIKRGLAGYVSYLAACEMKGSFSEYVLYEPILRVLTARHYAARCEVEAPGVKQPQTGDRRRLDFVVEGPACFALEVKWAKSRTLDVRSDHEKLTGFLNSPGTPNRRAFLCVFGTESNISDITLKPARFVPRGDTQIARFGVTRFGCRVFELVADATPAK